MITDTRPWYELSEQNNTTDGIAYIVNILCFIVLLQRLSLSIVFLRVSVDNTQMRRIYNCAYPMLVLFVLLSISLKKVFVIQKTVHCAVDIFISLDCSYLDC